MSVHSKPHGPIPTPSLSRPSDWAVRFSPLIRARGPVLDIACGSGRHIRFFHDRGHPVTGIDIDHRSVEDLYGIDGIEILRADLEGEEGWPLGERKFSAVVVTNYLHRPLFPQILDALEPDGVLIYETFGLGNQHFGRPSHPSFLLRAGELIEMVRGRLEIVAYENGEVTLPRPAVIQRLCAVNSTCPDTDRDCDPPPAPLPLG